MRVLFTTTGSAGHLGPLLPFADAVRRGGGEVILATRASSAERARATGHDVWPFADAPAAERAAIMASLRALPNDEANAGMLTEVFGGIDASAAIPGLLEACATWRPDVMISEPSEFAGRVVSGHLHLPTARVAITQFVVEQQLQPLTEQVLRRLRAEHGLAEPNGTRSAAFTLMPPLLEDPVAPGPPGVRRFREPDAPAPAALPDWWDGADGPLVYVTFGSVAPQHDHVFPALYRAAIDAVAPLGGRVLVTTGRDRDPAELGALPANVHVERWVPQAAVLPHAAAIVCHGGTGTVRGALAAGVPPAILPLFADQPHNAARVHALGAGIAVDGPTEIAGAVRALLADPGYADRAAAVAAEIRALPPVDAVAAALRALVS